MGAPEKEQDDAKPFNKLPEETDAQFAAFVLYRDMGAKRSLQAAYRASDARRTRAKRADGNWTKWCIDNRWVERSAAYDAHLDAIKRKERERLAVEEHRKAIEDYQKRQREIAKVATAAAVELLKKSSARLASLEPEDIPPGALPGFFRAAAAVLTEGSNSEAQSIAVGELLAQLGIADQ